MSLAIPRLGHLEPVDLRHVWTSEADQFTPWLAAEENIALLGKTIGIELEVEAQEKEVGPFRADILCKDTLTGNWVLVENQLERTDHTHLGQLVTYSAGLKAVTIVWIAARFTEEHRAALDWLNEMTDTEIRFFGLEVEAWRIGDSVPAPKFNIVSKPNDWSSQVSGGAKRIEQGALSGAKQLQLAFWTDFKEYADEHATRIRIPKPLPQNWLNIALGRTGFILNAIASLKDSEALSFGSHEIRAEFIMNHGLARECFEILRAEAPALEAEMGEPLSWYCADGVKTCRVFLRRPADLQDRDRWPEYHAWLTQRLDRLHQAFQARVKALDLDEVATVAARVSADVQ